TSPGQTTVWAVSSPAVFSGLPADFLDLGVGAIVTDEWLREFQRNNNVAEASRYWKTNTNRAARLYTNADIDRLRRGANYRDVRSVLRSSIVSRTGGLGDRFGLVRR